MQMVVVLFQGRGWKHKNSWGLCLELAHHDFDHILWVKASPKANPDSTIWWELLPSHMAERQRYMVISSCYLIQHGKKRKTNKQTKTFATFISWNPGTDFLFNTMYVSVYMCVFCWQSLIYLFFGLQTAGFLLCMCAGAAFVSEIVAQLLWLSKRNQTSPHFTAILMILISNSQAPRGHDIMWWLFKEAGLFGYIINVSKPNSLTQIACNVCKLHTSKGALSCFLSKTCTVPTPLASFLNTLNSQRPCSIMLEKDTYLTDE